MSLLEQPWFPFWPGHWRGDPGLQLCSLAARGLWMELLSIAHEARPRGHVLVGEVAPTIEQLSRLARASVGDVEACLAEIEANGVCSRTDGGVIFSRRMVRDTEISEMKAKAGQKGGLTTQGAKKRAQADREPESKAPPRKKSEAESVSVYASVSDKEGGSGGNGEDLFPEHPTPAQLLAREWMQTQQRYQKVPADMERDLAIWVTSLERCVRLDGRPWERVMEVVRFVIADRIPPKRHLVRGKRSWEGWSHGIQSPMKLRTKNDDGKLYFAVIEELLDRDVKPATKTSSISTDPKDYSTDDDIDPL